MLKIGTLFSGGLAAAEFALKYENIEHEIIFACEFDKYARKQYEHFHGLPTSNFYEDVRTLNTKKYKNKIDLLVWGSPCQDLSLAGRRKGLNGDKSSLFKYGAKIQKEIMPKIFIFENVKGLLSSNKGNDYKEVINTFKSQGYLITTLKMNTKDYGIPQNRERIFIIGFLNAVDYHKFKEPKPFPLKLKLKDLLEKEVDDKYYLSQKMLNGFISHKKRYDSRGFGFKIKDNNTLYASCITTGEGNKPTSNWIKVETFSSKSQGNKICDVEKEDHFHTLCSGSHGYSNGYVKIDLKQVGNIDQKGHNSLWGRVYDPDGIATTQNANGGGAGAKTGLYIVKTNTKKGFEEINQGDSVNLTFPNSKTRRGRVGKEVSQTLDCACNQGVLDGFKIRRLTPYETFLLQGVKPDDIKLVNSDTQSYKISGNAISVNVMQELLKALYKQINIKDNLLDFMFA